MDNPDQYYGQLDQVGGWIKNIKKQKNLIFISLSDGSCNQNLQIIIEEGHSCFEEIKKQCPPACLRVKGLFVKSPKDQQPIEMVINSIDHQIEILGINMNPDDYVLSGKRPSLELLRDHLHLRPRTNLIPAMARTRNALAMATHEFFQKLGFVYVHTPIITSSDCEGAGEMFQVTNLIDNSGKKSSIPTQIKLVDGKEQSTDDIDYQSDFFKKKASLTVSGQLAVENYACALTNVYTFGPTFRAENSHTSRHLAEFWMIEPEICFAQLPELFVLIESYMKYCIDYCFKNIADDMAYFEDLYKKSNQNKSQDGSFGSLLEYLKGILSSSFRKISYTEAIEILLKEEAESRHKFKTTPYWGVDLDSEHERYICEKIVKGPVFIYNYPKEIKSFYMKLNDDKKTVQGTDCLLPFIGEIVGGSVREERLDVLQEQLKSCGLNEEDYKFYLDLRRYGTVPHAGFGLGFERMVMLVSGIENIRDAIPFPRVPGKCDC